jgi:uncharacterized protein (DUF342 family)
MQEQQKQRLSGLSRELSQQLHDDTTQFKRDDMGRTLWSTKQLLDYAATHARSQEELANYEQLQTQLQQRRTSILRQAYKVISQELSQISQNKIQNMGDAFSAQQQEENQKVQLVLTKMKTEMERKLSEDKRKAQEAAAHRGMIGGILTTIGTVGGGIIAGLYSGGAAAPVGAAAGGAIMGGIANAEQL